MGQNVPIHGTLGEMKLAAKLICVVLAVVILMTAVGSYFSVRRAFSRFELQQEQLARETAHSLDEQVASAWQTGGQDGVLNAIEALNISDSRRQVRWVWFERTQLEGGASRTTVVEQVFASGRAPVSKMITDESGHRQLRTYYPMDLGDGPQGGLEVTGSLEALEATTRETITTALVSIGVMAALSFGLVYVAGVRWIGRPLDRLIAKTERIGKGDFGDPLPVSGNDELSQLARALNGMSLQLAEQQQRIYQETAERLATVEQLRHADRLKTVGRLAAGVAHELGTPLNVVSGRAGLIASGKLSAEEVSASANTIKSEADRITSIIRQLLEFARPGVSRRATFDAAKLLQETAALVESLAEKNKVLIEVTATDNEMVSADRGQLQQVITNLLVNAIQAMPDGGTVTASVDSRQAKPAESEVAPEVECVVMAIRDEGTGIEPKIRDHIFEPFFTTKDIGEGTGLGLSIAYGIVQEHGGWLEVETEIGRGSCFTIYLPKE